MFHFLKYEKFFWSVFFFPSSESTFLKYFYLEARKFFPEIFKKILKSSVSRNLRKAFFLRKYGKVPFPEI